MKNTLIISAFLQEDKNKFRKPYGKPVYDDLVKISKTEGISLKEISYHKKNVWCRDYMPIKRADGHLVQFKYAPSYMKGIYKWGKCLPIASEIHEELGISALSSDIILDGGAIEVLGDQAIVSDRVLRDNFPKDKYEILAEIKEKLKLSRLIVVPEYPYDFTGHVDGIARFIDSETVLINDDPLPEKKGKPKNFYREKLLEQWHYSFLMAFENVGLKVEKIPMTQFKNTRDEEHLGLYINFLKMDNLIVMPSFDQKEDDEAVIVLKDLYKRDVVPINATKLAPEGGLINCVTWNY